LLRWLFVVNIPVQILGLKIEGKTPYEPMVKDLIFPHEK
jgi:hypothetical protein